MLRKCVISAVVNQISEIHKINMQLFGYENSDQKQKRIAENETITLSIMTQRYTGKNIMRKISI